MAYSIGQYFNQDTSRHQWAVSCSEAAFDESKYKRGFFTAEGVQYDDID